MNEKHEWKLDAHKVIPDKICKGLLQCSTIPIDVFSSESFQTKNKVV